MDVMVKQSVDEGYEETMKKCKNSNKKHEKIRINRGEVRSRVRVEWELQHDG